MLRMLNTTQNPRAPLRLRILCPLFLTLLQWRQIPHDPQSQLGTLAHFEDPTALRGRISFLTSVYQCSSGSGGDA
jgi:hypothetical protein